MFGRRCRGGSFGKCPLAIAGASHGALLTHFLGRSVPAGYDRLSGSSEVVLSGDEIVWLYAAKTFIVFATAVLLILLAYRLLSAGVEGNAGLEAGNAKVKVKITKASPGLFFGFFGTAIALFGIHQFGATDEKLFESVLSKSAPVSAAKTALRSKSEELPTESSKPLATSSPQDTNSEHQEAPRSDSLKKRSRRLGSGLEGFPMKSNPFKILIKPSGVPTVTDLYAEPLMVVGTFNGSSYSLLAQDAVLAVGPTADITRFSLADAKWLNRIDATKRVGLIAMGLFACYLGVGLLRKAGVHWRNTTRNEGQAAGG